MLEAVAVPSSDHHRLVWIELFPMQSLFLKEAVVNLEQRASLAPATVAYLSCARRSVGEAWLTRFAASRQIAAGEPTVLHLRR